VQEWNKKLYN